jgi:serine/threonine protein kinase
MTVVKSPIHIHFLLIFRPSCIPPPHDPLQKSHKMNILQSLKAKTTIEHDIFCNHISRKENLRSGVKFDERSLLDLLLNSKGKDRDLLINDPDIEDDEIQNGRWEPTRALGEGGFGCVTLYEKKVNGQVVDSMALKESKYSQRNAYDSQEGIIKEAVYQYSLNMTNDSQTLLLRRYKYLSRQKRTRMYLEAGHCDLNVLRRRYRAWDKYLPEMFLWKVFLSLAKAADKMEKGHEPWRYFNIRKRISQVMPEDVFLLHFDIKPHNILLTDPDADATQSEADYPEVKLADFGLAQALQCLGLQNPTSYWGRGTEGFIPPEQNNVGAQWKKPPNRQQPLPPLPNGLKYTRVTAGELVRNDRASYGICFTSAHNIWAIGKSMSDLTYLEEHEEYEKQMPLEHLEEETYSRIGLDMIGVRQTKWYEIFSEELRRTITSCLDIDAENRPTAERLIQACERGLQRHETQLRDFEAAMGVGATDDRYRKLYFRGNEINDMKPGECDFQKSKGLYRRLQEEANIAFDGDLKLPPKWQPFINDIEAEARLKGLWLPGVQDFRREGGKIIFRPQNGPNVPDTQARPRMNEAMNQLGRLITQANGGNDELDAPNQQDGLDVLEELEARRNLLLEGQLDVQAAFALYKARNPDKVAADPNAVFYTQQQRQTPNNVDDDSENGGGGAGLPDHRQRQRQQSQQKSTTT